MSGIYRSTGIHVELAFPPIGGKREVQKVATCPQANKAAKLLQRARVLNDVKRRYAAAARLIAEAEALPGFMWHEERKSYEEAA